VKPPRDRQPRKTATSAARRKAAPAAPVDADADAGAPIDLDALPEPEPELVPLFVLDGRTWMVEAHPSPSIGLQVLRMAREQGYEIAVGWMLEALIGSAGYDALCGSRKVTQDAMQEIVRRALGVTVGPVEAAALDPLGRG
jgi:hypothetical protein